MSLWSEFCKKYSIDNGITYTQASRDPLVKELYKAQKAAELAVEIEAFDATLEIALEVPIQISTLEEILEIIAPELPKDVMVTTIYEPEPLHIATEKMKSKVFISKQKRGNK
jgi:hypothetical protein